jgi:hypothetical protein
VRHTLCGGFWADSGRLEVQGGGHGVGFRVVLVAELEDVLLLRIQGLGFRV